MFQVQPLDADVPIFNQLQTEEDFRKRAAEVYKRYSGPLKTRFRWLRADRFLPQLTQDLKADIKILLSIMRKCGAWKPERDEKLAKLYELITKKHPGEKVLVFSQFADTVTYLNGQLASLGVERMAGATVILEQS